MANSKLIDLTPITSPATTDLVYITADPGGTPLDRKCTLANLKTAIGVVSGPGSATDGHLAVFDGTTGKLIKDGGASAGDNFGFIQFYVPASDPTSITGTWSMAYWEDIGLQIYGSVGWQSDGAQNNELSWDFWLAAGTYTAVFYVRKSTNTGIITLKLDGASQGTADTYAASGAFAKVTITGMVVAAGGKKTVQIIIATKHASSSGYYLGLLSCVIRRTA